MNKTIRYSSFLIVAFFLLSCGKKAQKETLNITQFLSLADQGVIYPSVKQLEMLKSVIPDNTFQPSPDITNREHWNKIARTESGQEVLNNAIAYINRKPEVPISDSIYKKANKEGNRGIYKPRYYRTMTRLESFILGECIENKGRFIPQIETYLQAIMDMKSWLHPNHDDSKNGVLEGKRVSIDLGARRFGSDLALAKVLLRGELSESIGKKISEQLEWRITDNYLISCKENDKNNKWIKSTSNWNSVCTSGSLFTTIATSNSKDKRAAAIGSALNSMTYYLSGFGDDGYCSEGAGYWGYGFGHYLYLAEILYDFTEGAINLFEFDNAEKLINVANFPQRYQIAQGVCAPFADGVSKVSNDGGFASKMVVRKYGAALPPFREKRGGVDTYSAAYQLVEWQYMGAEINQENEEQEDLKLSKYTYFDQFGMVISRGQQEIPLSIAIKAGHNSENHNHMDVGTYTVVLGKEIMTGDIGAPSYRAGAFSDNNPARSSWGHPVPRIDDILQSKGRDFKGEITSTEFTEELDKVVMNIKTAYDIPILNTLVRIMENDKSGQGTISITDEFSLSRPVNFGVAIMTISEYEIVDANTVLLKTENQILKAEVFSDDGALVIKDELVPVEHLREGGPAYRIGVDFIDPIAQGSLTVKFTPVL
ncbi:hypothetical protein [Algibacter mikhailovii]|uniref:hypothetical protein n=1 Tax=Algibacter mikhailovii TaxID=425498 RepID=UPI0024957E58|nr:hypothetical protein [Algibacter mikhailovii]